MKKIYSLLVVVAFLLIPFVVFAAVDITLRDTSTQDSKIITIDIDTQTDVLDQVSLPIRFSEGVIILELTAGDIECSTLEYGEDEGIYNETVIRCILQEPSALDGTLVNISFTSIEELYTFELLDNEDLDIGTLTLGETVNVGDATDTEAPVTEEGIGFEDEAFTVTQEGLSEEINEGFNINNLTEYLPYILIAGSVILLISIIAILLSKKKGPKDTAIPTTRTSPQPPVQSTEAQEEPSLRSMVNGVNNTESQPQVEPEDETVLQNDSSFTTTPPISNTQTPLQQTAPVPPTQPNVQEPPVQRTSTPEITPSTQEEDLQEILKRESSGTQSEQIIQPTAPQTPLENQPSIQQPPQEVPFSGNLNVDHTQTQYTVPQTQPEISENVETSNQLSPEYPSVPPSAFQPTQQVPPVVETPEELPDVPPTM